ncbi:hypothetical protein [Bacillus tequilensis]|uniref:hypothetical protein n=1 Tax=Bacillus tequilensis TaxID=227866 RepID=UPI0004657B02|nr:hypothetical protein [Bacillus tequilensis]MDR4436058.1 hypothetical protein [Bacillus tequilensis]SPT93154.1 phage-like protein [Bacillus tequilensis]
MGYTSKNYKTNNGDKLVIGGELEIKSGAKVTGLPGSTPAAKSITSQMIGDGEVKNINIGDGSVQSRNIGSSSVQNANIAAKAVTLAKLGDDVIAKLTDIENRLKALEGGSA